MSPRPTDRIYPDDVQIEPAYLGLGAESKARCLPDSVVRGLGGEMYDTGDPGYWDTEGKIVFFGCNDRHIEICRLRIHLKDIKGRIPSCSGVQGCIGRGPSRRAGPTAGTNHRPERASGCGGVAKGQDTTVELDGDSSFLELDGHLLVQLWLRSATF